MTASPEMFSSLCLILSGHSYSHHVNEKKSNCFIILCWANCDFPYVPLIICQLFFIIKF